MAKSYSKTEFHNLMEKVETVDVRMKNYLELAGYDKWARSYVVHRGWTLTSNIVESINAALVSARELSIYDFLKQQALYTFTDLICKFQQILQQNEAKCTRMKLDEIPCVHACAILDSKNFKKGLYCSDLYKPKTVLRTYDLSVYPLPHKDDWIIPKKILNEM
ncbi:uncharacterized protein LOC124897983 [Capsicum annuum]|uniref:uncharacterized protein LOC124897983 n=1 Tax=Capsicum annuum TaxID=4072 RepID=UPI001FB109BE|nr:uncharacterized protein LOC124897983 [Capsicum annuum]